MKGLRLDLLRGELKKVAPEHNKKPILSITDHEQKFGEYLKEIGEYHTDFSFHDRCCDLPLEYFSGFTFDELCKIKHSTAWMMDESVDKLFKTHFQYDVVRKIESSMWRWGYGQGLWNDVVDAYDCLRKFNFGDRKGFEIRLDYSTWFNERGYSKYSRTFLDGVFAILVHYKGEHVMTLGFSIIEGKRILIQQIQSTHRRGSRFLFKLPSNHVEFVIDLFRNNFPDHRIFLIDGESLLARILHDYRSELSLSMKHCREYEEKANKAKDDDSCDMYLRWFDSSKRSCEVLKEKISHLEGDMSRLVAMYRNTGKFVIKGRPLNLNGLDHRLVVSV